VRTCQLIFEETGKQEAIWQKKAEQLKSAHAKTDLNNERMYFIYYIRFYPALWGRETLSVLKDSCYGPS
jgi:hypothetical protein